MQTQLERPSIRVEGTNTTARSDARYVFAGLTVACIWLATAAASIWSPVMITGIEHERLAIAAVIDWFPAAIASGLVLMAFSRRTRGASRSLWLGFLIAIGSIWAAVAAVSIFSPALVTGSDPTTVPIAVFAAPIGGVIATAFASVFVAGTPEGPNGEEYTAAS
jgi:hypothetical protein